MSFSALLTLLAGILHLACRLHRPVRRFIAPVSARILVKTADGRRARLFVFHKGRFSSKSGDSKDFDAALVFSDPWAGLRTLASRRPDAAFRAAAAGRLRIEGMTVHAQWFQELFDTLMPRS